MQTKQRFGNILRNLREKENLSQTDLAKELGVSRVTISYYENGERTADVEFAVKAAKYFNCSTDYLMGLSEYKNEEDRAEFDRVSGFFADRLAYLDHDTKSKMIFALADFIEAETKAFGYDDYSSDEVHKQDYKYLQEISTMINEYAALFRRLIDTKKYLVEKEDLYTKLGGGNYNEITHTASYFFRLMEQADKINIINRNLVSSLFDIMLREYENLM